MKRRAKAALAVGMCGTALVAGCAEPDRSIQALERAQDTAFQAEESDRVGLDAPLAAGAVAVTTKIKIRPYPIILNPNNAVLRDGLPTDQRNALLMRPRIIFSEQEGQPQFFLSALFDNLPWAKPGRTREFGYIALTSATVKEMTTYHLPNVDLGLCPNGLTGIDTVRLNYDESGVPWFLDEAGTKKHAALAIDIEESMPVSSLLDEGYIASNPC